MRVGVAIPTWGPFSDLGVLSDFLGLVEDLGFESAWLADHVAIPAYATDRFNPPMLEPLAFAGWALAKHDRLRMGTDVLVAPYRHPILVAAMAGTIQRLSGGRLTLGVGIGYLRGELSALGIQPDHRAQITDDVLAALRTLWSGEGPRGYAGPTFTFEDIVPVSVPSETVPLLVGGNNANARLRAALLGDGWHPLYPTPPDYATGREEIERLRREHDVVRPFLFSLSAPGCEVVERGVGRGERSTTPSSGHLRKEYRYAPERPCTPDGRPLLCGTREQVVRDLDQYRQAGVDQIVLRVWTSASMFGADGAMDQLRVWAEVLAQASILGG